MALLAGAMCGVRNDSCSRKHKYARTSHGMASESLSRGVDLFFCTGILFLETGTRASKRLKPGKNRRAFDDGSGPAAQVPSFVCARYSSFSAAFHSGQSERARASFALVSGLLRSQADLAAPKGPAATYAFGLLSHQVTFGAGLRFDRRGPCAKSSLLSVVDSGSTWCPS